MLGVMVWFARASIIIHGWVSLSAAISTWHRLCLSEEQGCITAGGDGDNSEHSLS